METKGYGECCFFSNHPNISFKKFTIQYFNWASVHWFLAIIDPQNMTVTIADSIDHITKKDELRLMFARAINATSSELKMEFLECEQQPDGSSCGLYTIAFAIDYLMDRPMSGYNVHRMRDQLIEMIETGNVKSFSENIF